MSNREKANAFENAALHHSDAAAPRTPKAKPALRARLQDSSTQVPS